MTLTATPDTAVNPAETQPDAGRRGRVWKAPGIPEAKERPPRGATAIALLTAGALTLGGAVVANLDDGPPAPERAVASMFEVTDEIGAQSLWTQGITGAGVNVAVIDTGIAPVPELSDQIVAAVDLSGEVVDPSVEPGDAFGHGTHMAGIIAGRQPGSDPAQAAARPDDFFGVAPDAGLVSVKVAQADGSVTGGSLVAGIDWVVAHADEHEISVLTLAFDAGDIDSYRTDPVAAALERAWAAGIVVVTAAGNQGSSSSGLASTARDPYVIAVAGTDSTSATVVPDWASAGDGVRDPDLAAPGAHIASLRAPGSNADVTHPEGRVGDREFLASGSSPAAAVVTGVAALLLDARPDLRPDQVKHLLVESAVDLDAPAKFVGNGLVDASAAVTGIATTASQNWAPSIGIPGPTDFVVNFDPASSSWASSSWASSSWASSSWASSSWASSSWASSSWASIVVGVSSWASSSWASSSWASSSWASSSWASSSWASSSWASSSWASSSWASSSWASSSWASSSWASSSWASSSWASSSWASSSWASSSWASSSWA